MPEPQKTATKTLESPNKLAEVCRRADGLLREDEHAVKTRCNLVTCIVGSFGWRPV